MCNGEVSSAAIVDARGTAHALRATGELTNHVDEVAKTEIDSRVVILQAR
jgi:hypothetical protein